MFVAVDSTPVKASVRRKHFTQCSEMEILMESAPQTKEYMAIKRRQYNKENQECTQDGKVHGDLPALQRRCCSQVFFPITFSHLPYHLQIINFCLFFQTLQYH